jgi:hypothetical protein
VLLDLAVDELASIRDVPVAALTKPHAFGLWEHLYQTRGIAMANGVKAVASTAFSYGELRGWRAADGQPWRSMGRPATSERLAIWLPPQVNVFVAAADADLDTLSVGDAFVIALHSAQRLGDVLAMPQRIFTRHRIELSQMKRGALIDVKMTQQVADRIVAILARASAVSDLSAPLIVNERTGEPYNTNIFNNASAWCASARLPSCPRSRRGAVDQPTHLRTRRAAIPGHARHHCNAPGARRQRCRPSSP